MKLSFYLLLFSCSLPASTAWTQTQESAPAAQRPYRIMDWIAREELREAGFSRDGQMVTFVRRRAADSQLTNGLLTPETRDDVWLQAAPGKPAVNLTNGASDASGWWNAQWSPGGDRLALLSSRGGLVTLWAWERSTRQVRQLSREGLDYDVDSDGGYRWIDDRRILMIAMPENAQATPMGTDNYVVGRGVEQAEAAWAKAKRGELTRSVVDSTEFNLSQRRLLVLDIETGAVQHLGKVSANGFTATWLSPDVRTIAFIRPTPSHYVSDDRLKLGNPFSIDLRTLDRRPLSLAQPLPANVVTATLSWSPDGRELAFFALEDRVVHRDIMYPNLQYMYTNEWSNGSDVRWPQVDSREYPGRLWRVNVRSGEVRVWNTGDIDLGQGTQPPMIAANGPGFFWTQSGELLFKATRLSDRSKVTAKPVAAWWVLSREGQVRAGDEKLRAGGAREAERVAQRQAFETNATRPAAQSELAAFSSQGNSGLYAQTSWHRDGDVLWRVSADGTVEELARVNTYRRALAPFKEQLIEYTCLNGETCVAKVMFPYGYEPGRRYPVVLDSDTNYMPETAPHVFELAGPEKTALPNGVNVAAGGYVYLWASMPTMAGMDETGRGNLLNFTGGILPALEKVVQMGIADPDRLFLHGGSSMGHAVFGLVTQTSRFKAAVAAVGWVDHTSRSLSLNMQSRYGESPFDHTWMGTIHDYVRLPPWRDVDRRRRNSPLTYVDRVQTPLLIMHGDIDGTSLSNPEMFFSALVLQRKPARFVRYWGEGHVNQTPANYRDYYQQAFAWYDQWGDIARDAEGNILFDENGRVKSRHGAPPPTADDYASFDVFGPGGDEGTRQWLAKHSTAKAAAPN